VLSVDVEWAPSSDDNAIANVQHCKVPYGKGVLGKARKIPDWWKAGRAIRRFRPDLCISSAPGRGYSTALGGLRDCFTVWMIVSDEWTAADPLFRSMLQVSSALAFQAPTLHSTLEDRFGIDRPAAVLPCFSKDLPPHFLAKKPIEGEAVRVCFFGRLAENKGLSLLLSSLRNLSDTEFQLDIWGAGPLKDQLAQEIEQLRLSSRVRLCGRYPDGENYARLLSSYHGLVLPSQRNEGVPLVLLEAASVGVAFMATDVGAIRDCAVDNPDVTVVPTGRDALSEHLPAWLARLRGGKFDPARLRSWFMINHSRPVVEGIWRRMLSDPPKFFHA
jgi:glycosyltransferase involved in cell wall biosynthesis